MSKTIIPEDAPKEIEAIVVEARSERNSSYNLIPYSTDKLKECLSYLESHNMFLALQRDIKKEFRLRSKSQQVSKPTSNLWFPDLWWAVLSLFGKGEMNRNAPETKALLAKIDVTWRNNCGGHGK